MYLKKTELEIKTIIEMNHPEWKLDRVVKIPSNERLMKLVCANVRVANDIMEKGLVILNQRFSSRSLEKEIYVNVTPCFKCYKFDHTTKNVRPLRSTKCAPAALSRVIGSMGVRAQD